MQYHGPMDFVPVWLLFIFTVVVAGVSIEVGYRFGRYRSRTAQEEKETPVGSIIGATLGLLAFILAFTFGLAATRFDARRQAVVEEATILETTYLRAGLLPNHLGDKSRALLREYLDRRLDSRLRDANSSVMEEMMRRSQEIHAELWKEAEAIGGEYLNSELVAMYIQSLNDTIEIHARRRFVAFENALPLLYWFVLYLVTILTMAGVGYHEGLVNSSRSPAQIILVLAFSFIMTLIADLDTPQTGYLRVSQQSLIELQKTLMTAPSKNIP